MKMLVYLLTFVLVSGCFTPSINGRSRAAANAGLSFKTFMYQLIPGLGTISSNSATDELSATIMDANGYTYVCGVSSSNMYGAPSGSGDVIIAKFDNAGLQVWGKQWNAAYPGLFSNPTNYEICNGLAFGLGDTLYVGGYTFSDLFDTANAIQPSDMFIAKVSTVDGSLIWGRQFNAAFGAGNTFGAVTANGVERGGNVATDPTTGDVYYLGNTDGATVGPPTGTQDIVIFKVQSNGTFAWAKQLTILQGDGFITNDAGTQTPGKIVTDSSGNAYFSGYTSGVFTAASGGSNDAVLGKIAPNGTFQWIKQFTAATYPGFISNAGSSDALHSLAIDSNYVYGLGMSRGSYIALNTNATVTYDAFVIKMNQSDGSAVWMKQLCAATYGANINDAVSDERIDDGSGGTGGGIGVDSLGNVYVSGSARGNFLGANTNAGVTLDVFVAKLDSAGSWVWGRQISTAASPFNAYLINSTGDDTVQSVAVRTDGNISIVGTTTADFIAVTPGAPVKDAFMIHLDKNGNL